MSEFGARFKKARESQNISLDRIAVETCISTRFLRAIEDEQFEALPGGIFNRGFIRTYASRLGIDPEQAIRTYETLAPAVDTEHARHEFAGARGRTTRIPVYYAAIAALVVLVAVFYLAKRPAVPMLVTPAVPLAVPSAVNPDDQPAEARLAPTASDDHDTASAVSTAAVSAAGTAVTSNSVVVELETRQESWFKLSSDGTSVVEGEVLPAGTSRRYTAANAMDLRIGNAAGVQLRVNGESVPSLGGEGQVRFLTITPDTSAASLAASR